MQDGFTFLELIIVLGIIAVLALLALPQYDSFLNRHQAQADVEQLVRTITLARQQALLRNEIISLCPNDLSQSCGENWSSGLLVRNEMGQVISSLAFNNDAQIILKTFPVGHEYLLQFSGNGYTQTQNGSFYYCPHSIDFAKRIVFNQAGRVYVTTDGAFEACESTLLPSL